MNKTYIVADNVVSPIGWTTEENFNAVVKGHSGIRLVEDGGLSPTPFYASLLGQELETNAGEAGFGGTSWTRFEKLALLSMTKALAQTSISLKSRETVFILSTTKGNIELLDKSPAMEPSLLLGKTAEKIASTWGYRGMPVVVAHACISGLAAILVGKRLLEAGSFKHAVITGADVVSRFVVSGFQSFQALDSEPCRPFDKNRKGLNLGEACGTIILSSEPPNNNASVPISVVGGSASNDANHISGPSRTGEELSLAIGKALRQAGQAVDFISAHGTATAYNDEMEAKAFALAGLTSVPLHSMKANFGHTLGAAGLIESIMSVQSLRENTLLPSLGYAEHGVSMPVTVSKQANKQSLTACLKTASGFGGCNAALVFSKNA